MQSDRAVPNSYPSDSSKVMLCALTENAKTVVWSYLSTHEPKAAKELQKAASNEVIRILIADHNATLAIDSHLLPLNIQSRLCYMRPPMENPYVR